MTTVADPVASSAASATTLDLRLLPPAVAAWASAVIGVALPGWGRAGIAAVATVALVLALWRGARSPRARHRDGWQTGTPTLLLGGLLVALVMASITVQDAVRTGGLEAVASWQGSSTLLLRTTGGAEPVASAGIDGAARVKVSATLLHAEVRGEGVSLRSPVLVIAPASWATTPPGVVVRARGTTHPTGAGEREVAVVVVEGAQTAVRGPPWWRVVTHGVRTDLTRGVAEMAPHAGLLPGIGVGDDSLVPDDLRQAMRATSLGHLLAVSGAHVAIVLSIVLVLVAGLPRAGRAALCLLVLGALVALVGPDPSVVRAAAMGGVVVLAQVLGRRSAALPALATAVALLVLADPWIARAPGFALSVCATAGLIVGAGPLARLLERRLPSLPATVIAVPLAAQLACLPILVLMEPGLATYGVPANVLVAPVVPFVTVLTLAAASIIGWWPTGGSGLLWTAQAGTWWIDQVAQRCAALPLARLPWPGGVPGLVAVAALVLLAVWVARTASGHRAWQRLRRRGGPVALVLSGLLAVALVAGVLVAPWRPGLIRLTAPVVSAAFPPPDWRLLQCDVGQGSALLISTASAGGGGEAVMIDVGPAGGDVGACLEAADVARLEVLVLTHADADHVGALPEVIELAVVERVWVPATSDPRMAEVVSELRQHEVAVAEVIAAGAGEGLPAGSEVGALRLTPLWPTARAVDLGQDVDPNELSLTLWVEAPGLTMLVHGDLGEPAQAALGRAWPRLAEAAPDVVVVAHHGSPDQDLGLLRAAPGRIALVSVGADNDYGHPAPATLAALEESGAVVARTDVCGPVAVAAGAGGSVRLAGCRGPRRALRENRPTTARRGSR